MSETASNASTLLDSGTHPVDVPLEVFQQALEAAAGQPLEIGIEATEPPLGLYTSGDGRASTVLAYGTETRDAVWTFSFYNRVFKRFEPSIGIRPQPILNCRDQVISADRRLLSAVMVADAEITPLGKFARNAIISTLRVPRTELTGSRLALDNVSHSQASRIVEVMRMHYAADAWRRVAQLALALPHFRFFLAEARETDLHDPSDNIVTVADARIPEELREQFKTDLDLLLARSLQKGIRELRSEGRNHAAAHTAAWLDMHEESLTIEVFTPEVTLGDVKTKPNPLNPEPGEDLPYFTKIPMGMGSYAVKYLDDRSDYVLHFPLETAHYRRGRGPLSDDQILALGDQPPREDHVSPTRQAVPLPTAHEFTPFVQRHLASTLVEQEFENRRSPKQELTAYIDALRLADAFCKAHAETFTGENRHLQPVIGTVLAGALTAARCLEATKHGIGVARGLFLFASRTGVDKTNIEAEIGFRLDGVWERWDPNKLACFKNFGAALEGFELARLAQQYSGHPEFSEHIAHFRQLKELERSPEIYYGRMLDDMRQFVGERGRTARFINDLLITTKTPRPWLLSASVSQLFKSRIFS
jgi:hypothetical protein